MSEARSFINPKTQNYASLKANTPMSANQREKFDALNAHIANTVVVGGELVIVGDPGTPLCTSHEAFLMGKAMTIHRHLKINGVGADDFFLKNFEFLQSLIANSAIGVGMVSDGWNKYLDEIRKTLEEISELYRTHSVNGAIHARDDFYARRAALFSKLDDQLKGMGAFGSGLRRQGRIKRMLEISTKRYLHTGEISGYADKVAGVAKAANFIKKGTYIGIPLSVASTGLNIHQACTVGREEDCRKAKYVETSALVGSVGGSFAGGYVGGLAAGGLCVAFGFVSGGLVTLGCSVIGAAAGGKIVGDELGAQAGAFGELIYERFAE